jgi:hypothetical protein
MGRNGTVTLPTLRAKITGILRRCRISNAAVADAAVGSPRIGTHHSPREQLESLTDTEQNDLLRLYLSNPGAHF